VGDLASKEDVREHLGRIRHSGAGFAVTCVDRV